MSKNGSYKYGAGLATPPSSLPGHRMSLMANRKPGQDESAIDDEQENDSDQNDFEKQRMRRASEGTVKSEGKSAKGELRCETCGKGYKHSSCLTKHLFVLPLLPRSLVLTLT
jgi:hypothetical protein